ncbi:MAG: type II toxin-antitoxin system RelE/ParE family toxin [Sphingobacteriales bacterium]|nr:type II toxin-antitoxin system RelE/ParE family toxin [Sphingobacteriales bacterium]
MYHYGIETFSLASASVFVDEITEKIDSLESDYLVYPECRFLETKSKLYRNIILIIYRITKVRIEVLNIIHSSRSISFIKSSRGIKL